MENVLVGFFFPLVRSDVEFSRQVLATKKSWPHPGVVLVWLRSSSLHRWTVAGNGRDVDHWWKFRIHDKRLPSLQRSLHMGVDRRKVAAAASVIGSVHGWGEQTVVCNSNWSFSLSRQLHLPGRMSPTTVHTHTAATGYTRLFAPLLAETEANFSCTHCNRVFKQKHSLKRHLGLHSGRRVQCVQCGDTFTRMDSLYKHQVRRHSGLDMLAVDSLSGTQGGN